MGAPEERPVLWKQTIMYLMSDMTIKKNKLMVRANYKPYLKSVKLSVEKIFIYKAQGNLVE